MDMFPTATAGKPQVIGMVETTEELPIYCACGQPDDGMEMIQCDKCQVWYQRACEYVCDGISGGRSCGKQSMTGFFHES